MIRENKTSLAILFSLLFAATILFASFADPVWAEGRDGDPVDKKALSMKASGSEGADEGYAVHADPATFEKNFCLTTAQKEYTIKHIEKAISLYTNPEMSDLQKYYELAKWANSRVVYDNDFWNGHYYFDYYSHQWDAYGAIKQDEKSVCAGIAIFYANLCHAADLPCKFVRLNPEELDHTISYIPDINGHPYYVDITENDFVMSSDACYFAEDADLDFSGIDKENENPDDRTFEFMDEFKTVVSTDIKECWQNKVSYKDWFKEYADHMVPDTGEVRHFFKAYEEKGSGELGTHYASYQDFAKYPAQPYENRKSDVTGDWFLDDFYLEPAEAKASILNKELDEQFLNISGVKGNYDCKNTEELTAAVDKDISIGYFPSVENGEVVAKEAQLTNGNDYTVTYASHDNSTGEEVLTIKGTNRGSKGYKGTCQIRVRMNSAIVKTAPARINGLVYNGSPQNLVEPGQAENGTMLYAVCEPGAEPADKDYTEAIPAETNVGKYDVWYKAKGDDSHSDMPAQKLERPVKITAPRIDDNDLVIVSGTVFTYNGKVQKPLIKTDLQEGTDYTVSWGTPSSKNVGTYKVTIEGKGNYSGLIEWEYQIKKTANPMKLKAKTTTVKHSNVRKKAQTIKRAKVITLSKAKGKPAYQLISAKNGKKNFKKNFKINAMNGNLTVKKGLKQGTYKVKVKVKAAGNTNYKASPWKSVTFKIIVK